MASLGHSSAGGYENEFVEEPHDRFVCSICLFPCRNAHMSACCGHNFCWSCLVSVINSSAHSSTLKCVCPVCRGLNFTAFKNKQADREIRSLFVYCTNRFIGCDWKGELNDLSTHVGTCRDQFEKVQCPSNCGEVVQRRYITNHVQNECSRRLVQCQYCDTLEQKHYVEGTHKLHYCQKLWAPCPNKCDTKGIPYDGISAHRQECPLEMVKCEYHSMGCDKKIVRGKRKQHDEETMEAHLRMTKIKLLKTEDKLSEAETRLSALETTVAKLTADHGPQVHVDVPAYTSLKESKVDWYSAVFETHPSGYRMKLNVVCSGHDNGTGTHVSVYLCNVRGQYDRELSWPLRGEFTVTLFKNGVEDYSRKVEYDDFTPKSVSRRTNAKYCRLGIRTTRISLAKCSARAWGLPQFITNSDVSRYLTNDKLSFIIWFNFSRMK